MDLNLFLVVTGTFCNLAMAAFNMSNKKTGDAKETIEAMTKMTMQLEHLGELFGEFRKEIKEEMELKRKKIEAAAGDIQKLQAEQKNLKERLEKVEERMYQNDR